MIFSDKVLRAVIKLLDKIYYLGGASILVLVIVDIIQLIEGHTIPGDELFRFSLMVLAYAALVLLRFFLKRKKLGDRGK